MRIGIDFDNTIICYDDVFCQLAKSWQLIDANFQGNKQQIKEVICTRFGDISWQRLQGKVYGEWISKASLFAGFKEFIRTCHQHLKIQVFIVSHKTEFGHFDEKKISLRDASRQWLHHQGFFDQNFPLIQENNVFFESTREDKIERIKSLQCTHFIDDLLEIFEHPLFPKEVKQFLFQPYTCQPDNQSSSFIYPRSDSSSGVHRDGFREKALFRTEQSEYEKSFSRMVPSRTTPENETLRVYPSWKSITHAIFSN